ncbi:MAG: glycosyltransferase family 4 protein [Pyrinomonadaceae bacterium]
MFESAGKEEKMNERPLRVLIVAPSLDILGGQAVQADRLYAHWSADPALEVSFLPVNPRLPGMLRALQNVKYVRTLVTSAVYLASLFARVRKADVIHAFSASYFSFVLAPTPAILVAKLYGKKVILNYRSGEADDHLRRWSRTAIPVMRLADAIAVPSGYLVDVFANFGLRARSIFNIVETDDFRFRRRQRLRPIFLSNRNFEPLYNVGCVLRAFAIIQRHFDDARLTMVGDGSQRAALEQLAADLNLRHVEFTGRVKPELMPQFYERADIYLNSPNIDNMPGSIIESYAAGLPIVTTDAGGIPYILTHEETGLLVARDDHEAMAAGAMRLLKDNALAERIALHARAECFKYSWDAVRDEWLGLYREVMKDRKQQQKSPQASDESVADRAAANRR